MKPLSRVVVLLALVALAAPAAAGAQPEKRYYLSLGDSLSVGVQPGASGANTLTKQGYAPQLARKAGRVKLLEYGCAGTTTEEMIKGAPCASPAHRTPFRNRSRATSQLAAAEKILRKNRKRMAFVTINIGANDVVSCGDGGKIDIDCVNRGIAAIKKNGPTIAKRLRRAAGRRVPMAVTTIYDPFLQQWFNGDGGKGIAKASVDIARDQFNPAIVSAFKKHGFKIARTAEAFDTYVPFERTTTYGGRSDVPLAVARICRLTWMCAAAPRGLDIHANKAGYGVMADAFRKALGRAAR